MKGKMKVITRFWVFRIMIIIILLGMFSLAFLERKLDWMDYVVFTITWILVYIFWGKHSGKYLKELKNELHNKSRWSK